MSYESKLKREQAASARTTEIRRLDNQANKLSDAGQSAAAKKIRLQVEKKVSAAVTAEAKDRKAAEAEAKQRP